MFVWFQQTPHQRRHGTKTMVMTRVRNPRGTFQHQSNATEIEIEIGTDTATAVEAADEATDAPTETHEILATHETRVTLEIIGLRGRRDRTAADAVRRRLRCRRRRSSTISG